MKKLIGSDIGSYAFNPTTKQVTITSTGLADNLSLEQVLLITNVTTNTLIYNFAKDGLGGTISGNVITLEYNTGTMSPTDRLQIFVDVIDNLEKVKFAKDYVQTFTYLDAGTTDERVSTIIHSSVSLNLSATETFVYVGTSPNYRISTITVS